MQFREKNTSTEKHMLPEFDPFSKGTVLNLALNQNIFTFYAQRFW